MDLKWSNVTIENLTLSWTENYCHCNELNYLGTKIFDLHQIYTELISFH